MKVTEARAAHPRRVGSSSAMTRTSETVASACLLSTSRITGSSPFRTKSPTTTSPTKRPSQSSPSSPKRAATFTTPTNRSFLGRALATSEKQESLWTTIWEGAQTMAARRRVRRLTKLRSWKKISPQKIHSLQSRTTSGWKSPKSLRRRVTSRSLARTSILTSLTSPLLKIWQSTARWAGAWQTCSARGSQTSTTDRPSPRKK